MGVENEIETSGETFAVAVLLVPSRLRFKCIQDFGLLYCKYFISVRQVFLRFNLHTEQGHDLSDVSLLLLKQLLFTVNVQPLHLSK